LQTTTKIIVALLLVAGALDTGTTFIGAQPRNENYVTAFYPNGDMQRYTIYESNPETRIMFFPFLSTAIFGSSIFAMKKIGAKIHLTKFSTVLSLCFLPFAFAGGISNLFILGVI
jgi:hypothetical protein